MSEFARIPTPVNEAIRPYAPGSPERASLKLKLADMSRAPIDIPVLIGGEEVRTGQIGCVHMPHRHQHVLATWHKAGENEVKRGIQAALDAREEWASWTLQQRAAVFLRAAELLATSWRDTLNAATMLNQSKTAHQAEIDAACEMIDFLRFNAHFAERIYREQPLSSPGAWNRIDYRPLEGFVYAVTPFNFTSIAGNLPAAPAILGNTVVWKCASSTVFSNHFLARLFEEAACPRGHQLRPWRRAARERRGAEPPGARWNPLYGIDGRVPGDVAHRWREHRSIRELSTPRRRNRRQGFHPRHESADPDALIAAIVRGGYEFQGQKCSAASRIYVPDALWQRIRENS